MKYYKFEHGRYPVDHLLIYKVKDENDYFEFFTKIDGWLQAKRTWKSYITWMHTNTDMKDVIFKEITETEAFLEIL